MKPDEALELVAGMIDMYPRQDMRPRTAELYVRGLADLPYDDALLALDEHQATSDWFPTVAEIRRLVAERRLQLPGPAEAWELLQLWIADGKEWVPCTDCGGTGWIAANDSPCTTCRAEGKVRPERRAVPSALRRATEVVGGEYALTHSEEPGISRAQWMRAYTEFRDLELRQAQLPPHLLGPTTTDVEELEPVRHLRQIEP